MKTSSRISKKVIVNWSWITASSLVFASLILAHPASAAVQLKGNETPDQIQDAYTKAITALIPDLGKNKEEAVKKFEATLHNASRPDAEVERLACCKAIAASLFDTNTPGDAKIWLMKLVAFAGKAEIVPALNNILSSSNLVQREYARCALQENPSPEAAAVLRDAIFAVWKQKTDLQWQAALAFAQAARKDVQALDGFITFMSQTNDQVIESALAGLGAVSSVKGVRPKAGILKAMPARFIALAAESYMRNAERLLKENKSTEAAELYRELYQADWPRNVRLAALDGLLTCDGEWAGKRMIESLTGTNADDRAIALGFIPDMPAAGLKGLAEGLPKLPIDAQLLVLASLADRGEKAALPTALEFAKSKDEQLHTAGLAALGGLGDASTVQLLIEALPDGTAKNSLTRLSAPQADEKIVAAMQAQTNTATRATLIEVIETRNIAAAVPVLLQESLRDSSTVRRPAIRALGKLAQPADVPAMLKSLLKTSPGTERDDAEKAIAAVCGRAAAPAQGTDAVLALYQNANASERLVLLPVLGRLGGKKVFDVIKASLASPESATAQAALDAMANWPDSDDAVEAELLNLAKTGAKPADRAAALRAYVRLIATPSGLPEMARFGKFQKAMELAGTDPEKNLVLEKLGEIKRIEVLRYVKPYLDQPALAQKASLATLDLARDRTLRGRNKPEFDAALQKVLAVCKDPGLLERASRYSKEKLQ